MSAVEELRKLKAPPPPPKITLVPFDKITLDGAPEYLVDGLVPREGITVVWGPPKCSKSFTVHDMTMHVALGWEYRGRRVEQGAVVYCAFEGGHGFKKRCAAFKQRFLKGRTEPVPFYLQPLRLDLIAHADALVAAIEAQLSCTVTGGWPEGEGIEQGDRPIVGKKFDFDDLTPEEVELCVKNAKVYTPVPNWRPAAVVLDTLNRSLAGSESKDEDMSAYVAAADKLREAFNCAVIIVHHCGVEGSRPRGHTSLTGAADAQLAVARSGEIATLTVEFMKDGEEGAVVASKLETVEVGVDNI